MCCSAIAFVVLSLLFATPEVTTNIVYAAPFHEVNINCEPRICSDNLIWLVNSVLLTNPQKEERDIVVRDMSDNATHCQSSVFTITALPINNNITIGCVAFKELELSYFDEITFKIRGVSAVRSLMFGFHHVNNSVKISWLPPAYISSDDSSDLLDYQVSVFDETGILIFYNATSTTFMQLLNITQCDTFNVSVAAFSGQYVSDESILKNNGSYGVVLEDNKCNWNNQIELILDYSPLNCPSFLSITDISTNKTRKIQTIWDEDHYITYTLSPFEHYSFVVHVINLRNEVKDSVSIEIYTYNVQDLNLKTNRSYTEMKCLYCMPKVNQSCCVKFSDIAQGVEENFVVSGLDEKIVTLKRNGNYTVTTYDLVNGSCIGPAIEPIQVVINYNSTISSATSSLGGSQVICFILYIFAAYACC